MIVDDEYIIHWDLRLILVEKEEPYWVLLPSSNNELTFSKDGQGNVYLYILDACHLVIF